MAQNIDNKKLIAATLSKMEAMQARITELETRQSAPIAVIGMGCRFPGGISSPEIYWNYCQAGGDAIVEVPANRWDISKYYAPEPTPGKMNSRYGGFLQEDITEFDARFFSISAREATSMDPQQRLLLEVTWEALENANIPPTNLAGDRVGVFVGITSVDHAMTVYKSNYEQIDSFFGTGNSLSAAAGRLSYFLNLRGPAMSIDAACASSLVAIHQAIRSLRNHECELALVAGVNLILNPAITINLSQSGMMSPDGRCKTFDAAANGYVRGEGCGVLVLQRLSAAQKKGDRILAVLRGSAVNHNGAAAGLTVPSGPAQQDLLRQALTDARVSPQQVGYIEAHGTGTSLGDPIEMNAIAAVYGKRSQPLYVGSVKTNIGHLEAAAGMAGMIKTILSLQHGEIPPHLHFQKPNPLINWQGYPIKIPSQIIPWSNHGENRIAGVSSFGFSGTNAHVIVEQAPAAKTTEIKLQRPSHLLTISAHNETALKELAQRFHTRLESDPEIGDICHSAAIGRSPLPERLAIVADTLPELQQKLSAFANEKTIDNLTFSQRFSGEKQPKIAFLFTGQGACYAGMGEQLYQTQPTFRKYIDKCADILANHLEHSLQNILFGNQTDLLNQTAYAQPAIFALEYSLTMLWKSWGIEPNLLIGHSVGEYVAACVAGVFSLEAGLQLVVKRGQLMQTAPTGKMAVVFADQATVLSLLENYTDTVSIAAINHPQQIVISGESHSIDQIIANCKTQNIPVQFLSLSGAYHSPLMEPILDEFETTAQSIDYDHPQILLLSGIDGQPLETAPNASYWRKQCRQPVQFLQSIITALNKGYNLFLEVGSRPILAEQGRRYHDEAIWLSSLNRGLDNWQTMLATLAQLYIHGISFNAEKFNQDYGYRNVQLPTYPFQRKRFQFQPPSQINEEHIEREQTKMTVAKVSHSQKHQQEIGKQLKSILAVLLKEDENEIRDDETLLNLGADSIILTDFTRKIEEKFSVKVRIDQLFTDLQRIVDIANYLSNYIAQEALETSEPISVGNIILSQNSELNNYLWVISQLQPIVVAYILKALGALGQSLNQAETWTTENLLQTLPIAPKYYLLITRYLKTLEQAGIIQNQGNVWTVKNLPTPFSLPETIENLQTHCPAAKPELEMLQRCGENLAEVIKGNIDPLELIFPAGSLIHAESIYGNSPVSRLMNQRVAQEINRILENFSSGDRPYQIIEVGGGTGATSEAILNNLNLTNVTYSFTELSPVLLNKARQKFQHRDHLNFHQLNIEKSPISQGIPAHSYHIVVAANVLHSTRNITETLNHIRELLLPGGFLVLLETVENNSWLDLTFGLTPGWWRFQDKELRLDTPLLSGETWCSVLKRCGFTTTDIFSQQNNVSIYNGQELIIASAPAESAIVSQPKTVAVSIPTSGKEALMMAQLQSLKDLKDIHEKTIIKQLEILQSASVAPSPTSEVLIRQTEPAPPQKATIEIAPLPQKIKTDSPKKPSSPSLNPLALKLAENKSLTEKQQAFISNLQIIYNQKTAKSKAYSQNSRKTMVDVKPTIDFRMALKEFQYPIVSESAQGAYFRDIDGNDYIDLAMGFGVNFFGHSPDFVIAAVQQQMQHGIGLGMQSNIAAETAALISEITGVERVAFSNTGTEAIMAAVRIARSRTKRLKIVLFSGSYHGTFDGILARVGEEPGTAQPLSLGTPSGMVEDVIVLTYGAEESLEIIAAQADNLAAVLVEPVQSRKPDLQPQEFLQKLRKLTHEKEIALIFDEIITGFRMALGGAQEWFDVEADIVVYGKAIGGGLPISMICGKADFLDTIDGGFWSYGDNSHPHTELTGYGGTFCRHPLALAACRAVLLHLRAQGGTLQKRVNQLTNRLATEVNEFFQETGIPIRIVNFGSLFRFEPFGAYSLFLQPIELPLFYYLLNLKGIYTWEKRVCFLSTDHTNQDIDKVVIAVKEAIRELRQAGFFENAKPPQAKKREESDRSDDEDGRSSINQRFPTSEAQRQLWLLAELDTTASASYNVTTSLELRGNVEISSLQQAINEVVNRHEALRTQILEQGELQEVLNTVKIDLPLINLIDAENPEAAALTLRTQLSQKPFDLGSAPLFASVLMRLAPEHYLLSLKTHHIVADGWSLGLILNEIGKLYSAKIGVSTDNLAPPMQFRNYLALRQQEAQSSQMQEHRDFWLKTYEGEIPVFELPTDFPRPAVKTYTGGRESKIIAPQLWRNLQTVGRKNQATLFMTMFAAYTAFLRRISGDDDLVIGIPISGRQFEGSEGLVGFCSQFLPIRIQTNITASFVEHLRHTKETLIAAFKHQSHALEELLAALQLQRDFSRSPLISVSFNMDPSLTLPEFEGLEVLLPPEPIGYTPFDLGFNFIEINDALIIYCNYNTELFKPETIKQFLESFEILMEGVINNGNSLLSQLPLLTQSQEAKLLAELQGQTIDLPQNATIIDDFIAKVNSTPNAPALIVGENTLSYRELNQKVNQLTNYLHQKYQLSYGKAIALIIGRNQNLIIAILATFKTGATYVPIDPEYPQSRIDFILKDSGCDVCLTESNFVSQLPQDIEAICLDKIDHTLAKFDTSEPHIKRDSSQIAYILYTSGSTGTPKGVMGCHISILNVIRSLRLTFDLDQHPDWHYIFTAPITHDPSLRNIFLPLTIGAALYMYEVKHIGHLVSFLQENQINALHTTPSIYREILAVLDTGETIPSLKYISAGGEKLDRETAIALRKRFPADIVSNVYGSTETCVGVAQYRIDENLNTDVPLGEVFHNNRLFVLDEFNNTVPLHVVGEICVEGVALASGYHNLPQITAEKFQPSFMTEGKTIFRTGDLGKQIAPGVIEFLGRKDNQVKVNGYRIDPGEIEYQLSRHSQIERAIVLPTNVDNQTQLSAYCKTESDIEISEIREFLSNFLPVYMIPTFFIFLKQFPLTRHGKIDLRSLAEFKGIGNLTQLAYTAPRNNLESKLVHIWEKILTKQPIGIFDNFFEIGGHSLLLSRVVTHVHKELNVLVKLAEFFKVPTIAGLAALVSKTQYDYQEPIPAITQQTSYPMSHGQRRLWALEFLDRNHTAYGMPSAYLFKGNLNIAAFENAFQHLLQRHEILRTTFTLIDNEPRQVVHESMNFQVKQIDLTEDEEQAEIIAEAIHNNAKNTFNLETGSLLKVNLLKVTQQSYIVLFNMHHIISDGWSAGVLIKDFLVLYHAYGQQNLELPPPLRIHYKDYSSWQEKRLNTSELQAQRDYWLNKLTPAPTRLNLPLDYARPGVQSFQGSAVIWQPDPELIKGFRVLLQNQESSLFMGLLTLVKSFLFCYTEQNEITVGSPIAGRNHPDLEEQIGFYVNMLVLRDQIAVDDSFATLLAKVKTTTLEAYDNQEYPFDKLVSDLNFPRDPSRNPLFDTAIVLQNNQNVELLLDGITVHPLDQEIVSAKFDLEFTFVEESQLYLKLIYNTDIFVHERISLMLKLLEGLLEEIVKLPEIPFLKLSFNTENSDEGDSKLFATNFNF
ncbi:amino acid adenylation domain-containing protein [Nodularia spumigena CS-588/02]|uniref:non-ribosomal peptide synthetase/type I polyketide synthase n=1 Tax=Nodularia spumigena TaxID=70799 RepID=UPI00232FE27E|nr:non-ribosomal peptide synthetase/type I polyketide synthase [Nodularia spumigena]MDB9362256.1 amino acid adenylation domain-containing protein [Nodularia spumigena CS-588/02]MDB9367225.1 amino acid adenylation domain-containing protein [Nodularia spumigena CS-588/02A10]